MDETAVPYAQLRAFVEGTGFMTVVHVCSF
jgi:hypothetical protein